MQRSLEDFRKSGGQLIAITPLIIKKAAALKEKLHLTFPILIDTGNKVSRQFGLVFTLSESLRPVYGNFGINIPEANGDNSFELPIPATYIIDTAGVVRHAYINADYTRRLDPEELIAALESLK